MNKSIQICSNHLDIITSIFKPYNLDVYVFGSRAKENARKFSDIDLLIKSEISDSALAEIKNKLEDSDIPIKCDVIVWDRIEDNFKKHIAKDLIKIL